MLCENKAETTKGMSEGQIAAAQDFYRINFPTDLKEMLMAFMPVGEGFYDWRDYSAGNVENIKKMLMWPIDGCLFDVENNDFWLKSWGEKPDGLSAKLETAREYMEKAPIMIPIYAHRYISSVPNEAGNPVYSVHQTDIIFYGRDIWDYFEVEFGEKKHREIEFDKIKPVSFWHDMIVNIEGTKMGLKSNTIYISEDKMKTLETERLILRAWRLEDLDDLYEYTKNPNVYRNTGWQIPSSREDSLKELKSFIENKETWAIVLKESGKVIGHLKIYPDKNRGQFSERNSTKFINYALSEDYWGKGYMTEAVKRAVKYAFDEMNVELLTVFHRPDNIGSRRVIEKCGFQYELTLERGIYNHGKYYTGVYHSILKSDYYGK